MADKNEPKELWRNQQTEVKAMTLEQINRKARELQSKTRQALLRNLGVALFTILLCAFLIWNVHNPAGQVAFSIVIAWSLLGQYFINRKMWTAEPPVDAGFSTSIDLYRREVERRRHLFNNDLFWSFAPLLLGIGGLIRLLVVLGGEIPLANVLMKMTPFLVLLGCWTVTICVVRLREQRELAHEIEELKKIESNN